MALLQFLFVAAIAFLILSFMIGAIPSIVRLILICIAIGLAIRLVMTILGSS